MAFDSATLVQQSGHEGGFDPGFCDVMDLVFTGTYATNGYTGVAATIRAGLGKGAVSILAIQHINGPYLMEYDITNDKLKLNTPNTSTTLLEEVGNGTAYAGTFRALVFSR